jgi:hypothetical protein
MKKLTSDMTVDGADSTPGRLAEEEASVLRRIPATGPETPPVLGNRASSADAADLFSKQQKHTCYQQGFVFSTGHVVDCSAPAGPRSFRYIRFQRSST